MKARNFLIGFTSLVLLACDSGIEEASCLDECSADARADCFGSSSTGGFDPCWSEVTKCGEASDSCNLFCANCEQLGNCPDGGDQKDCENKCNRATMLCVSMIAFRECYQEHQAEYSNQCVIPLIDCVAECADPETK